MIQLLHGDCLDKLKELPDNSVDSIVTDPPYGLSFMGKHWDYDVPSEEIWRECLRVLKPGGYLLSFAGTRTQHRMAVRIEDAGFEIRDMIAWTYGVGFPKSLNVRLNIDKQFDILKGICNQLPASVVAESFIEAPLISNEECFVIEPAAPTSQPQEQSAKYVVKNLSKRTAKSRNPSIIIAEDCVKDLLKESLVDKTKDVAALKTLLGKWLSSNETDISANFAELIENLKRTILEKLEKLPNFDTNCLTECVFAIHVTTTESTKECLISNTVDILKEVNKELHDGIGTALKPALEPITVARKPLSEKTVAQNVLTHGTGGINIDGCRVGTEQVQTTAHTTLGDGVKYGKSKPFPASEIRTGRFPANLIHDGSEEVVGLFPAVGSKSIPVRKTANTGGTGNVYTTTNDNVGNVVGYGDRGSAARFFYCAKASKKDRDEGLEGFEAKNNMRVNGPRESEEDKHATKRANHHPTVKPTDLMRYLCRLVTPKGGTVLDPFMGSGSTGKGAKLEGFNFIGIESEAEYVEIARARIDGTISDPQPKIL